MSEVLELTIKEDQLANLIKSNLSCYNTKSLSPELIDRLTGQIVGAIIFYLQKDAHKKNFGYLSIEDDKG